jgi:hypothetical protein
MQTKSFSRKYYKIFAIALLLVLVGASCLPPAAPVAAPVQTVVVIREVVTQLVTQIVYLPVTITPTPTEYTTNTPSLTPKPSETPTTSSTPPSATPTPQPPNVTVLVHTECYFGPDTAYIGMYDILANSPQTAIGRNLDTSWLYLEGEDHTKPCWVKTTLTKVVTGAFTDAPVASPVLTPYTTLYAAPPAASATRSGNVVTIFWQPVAMTETDYNGYLIQANVCQGGQMVTVAKGYLTSFDKNSKMMAAAVTDEPGCSTPSSARVYAAISDAYTAPAKVLPWPAFPTPTPSETPAP